MLPRRRERAQTPARQPTADPNDAAEPIENADATEPTEPIDANDPREPIDRNEDSDHSDSPSTAEAYSARDI